MSPPRAMSPMPCAQGRMSPVQMRQMPQIPCGAVSPCAASPRAASPVVEARRCQSPYMQATVPGPVGPHAAHGPHGPPHGLAGPGPQARGPAAQQPPFNMQAGSQGNQSMRESMAPPAFAFGQSFQAPSPHGASPSSSPPVPGSPQVMYPGQPGLQMPYGAVPFQPAPELPQGWQLWEDHGQPQSMSASTRTIVPQPASPWLGSAPPVQAMQPAMPVITMPGEAIPGLGPEVVPQTMPSHGEASSYVPSE
ncbi:unnamed protein product, partial [Effrenium voratum]